MRCLFLSALLVAGVSAAQAQTPASAPPATSASLASAHYSSADTVRAVRHLFQQRGRGAAGTVAAGGSLIGQGTSNLLQRSDTTLAKRRLEARQDVLAGSLVLGYGALRTQRFGPERYEQIVAAYEQGQPLPDYVRRRLKPKYFRYREF